MVCNRFKVWQDVFSLIVAASLVGCGSSSAPGTATSVPAAATTVAPASARPGMPSNAPGGAGHMNSAHMQPMAPGGQALQSGASSSSGSFSSSGAPGGQNSEHMAQMAAHMQKQNSGSSGGTPSPNMAAHTLSPGNSGGMNNSGGSSSNSNSPSNTDSSKMMAHTGSGGSSAPSAAAAPPGMEAPRGMAPNGSGGTSGGQANAHGASSSGGTNAPNSPAAQMRGPNGQPSSMPGQPGGAGGPGGNLAPGSVEDVLYRFCVAMADGDTAAAAEFVSPKAKGMIGQIRDGELSEEKLEEVTNAISPVSELQPNPNQTVTKRSLRNKKNQVITFTVKKDKDDEYKITELTISKPKK